MAKSICLSCGQHIEHPDELAGDEIECPNCGANTRLDAPPPTSIRIPKIKEPAEREAGASPVGPVSSRIIDNIERVIVGKRAEIVFTLVAYFAEGHVLLEDVPGVAKTMLARALARSIGCSFKRIQCTPDLLPSDITGSSIFNPKTTDFEFRPGPLFAQIVLADEINRATPRAQSALLEAMAERKVTADGVNYDLIPPFFLVATQNPIDHEGTFPLPEAQLDRFLVRLSLGYPGLEEEISMLHRLQLQHPIEALEVVATAEEVIGCQEAVRQVHVDGKVSRYIVEIIQATRAHPDLSLGGSPRASMALLRCAQSFAATHGFDFVMPDDVKQIARHVLGHRLILRPESRLRKKTVAGVLDEILKTVPVPPMPAAAPAPMKWIFATLGLLVLGLILKLSLLIYAMYVLLGVLLLSRFFTRVWTEQIEARRFCEEEVVEIGASAESKVAVQNAGRLLIPWVILEDSLSRDALTQMPVRLKAEGARLTLARLPAGETKVLSYRVKFLMRGYYQMGPLLVETGDVFGLHRRFRILTEPHCVLVLPKVLPLEGYSLASRRPVGEIRLTHRLFEDPTRMSSIRPYQQGDPLNRIHWRATARSGQLQTRTYESSCVSGATLLLDFHADSFAGSAGVVSAELAVVTVASLANAVFLTGQQIGFVSNGRDAADRIREEGWRAEFLTREDAQRRVSQTPANTRLRPVLVETGKGEDRFTQILAALGRLEHSDGLDFSAMVTEAAAKISRDATVVAVLGNVTPGIAAALGDLVRRGLLVTAVVVSFNMEAIPDWARPPEWAEMLLAQGIEFRVVNSEESISNLCAEAIVR